MITTTDSAKRFTERVSLFCQAHPDENVELFVDIDNTLLKMKTHIGSDQWFKWQLALIESEASKEQGRVADTLRDLQHILCHIYNTLPAEACEEDFPRDLYGVLHKHSNLRLTFITARSHTMRQVSAKQIDAIFAGAGCAPRYSIITCDGAKKVHHLWESIRKADRKVSAIFMLDDSIEHLLPFSDIPELSEIYVELFHYTHELPAVLAFHKETDKSKHS
jgi:hypothetical protein